MNKRNKNSKQAEVSEKLKEIKQRQHSWFKQREKEKSSVNSSAGSDSLGLSFSQNSTSSKHVASPVQPDILGTSARLGPPSPDKKPLVGETQVLKEGHGYGSSETSLNSSGKNGFQTWLEARHANSHNFVVRQNKSNHEGNQRHGSPLQESEFDQAAEDIIARVKAEMKLEPRQDGDGHCSSSIGSSSSLLATNPRAISGLDSHRCQLCSEFMVAPFHRPILLIPCGHNLCFACSDLQTCPLCECTIQSKENNSMLAKIISEYNDGKSGKNEPSKSGSSLKVYSLENAPSDSSVKITYPKKPEKDYAAEYHRLNLRCEILETESTAIKAKITDFDSKVQLHSKQIRSIDKEEAKLYEQIEELQEKVTRLNDHRREFEEQIEIIQSQKEEETHKLKMVQLTVSQLTENMRKARTKAQQLKQTIHR